MLKTLSVEWNQEEAERTTDRDDAFSPTEWTTTNPPDQLKKAYHLPLQQVQKHQRWWLGYPTALMKFLDRLEESASSTWQFDFCCFWFETYLFTNSQHVYRSILFVY